MTGKLENVGLSQVWQHQAPDFTTWLERKLDVLNDALHTTRSGTERQRSGTASFFVKEGFDEEPKNRVGRGCQDPSSQKGTTNVVWVDE